MHLPTTRKPKKGGGVTHTQEAMLASVNVAHMKVTPTKVVQRKLPKEMISAVLDKDTVKLMEYRKFMDNPKYRPLYRNSYAKEIGRLAQGMPGLIKVTNTMFLIDKTAFPSNRWRDVTYGRVVVDYRQAKTYTY